MKLYFMRHADALNGMDDDIRPLSPRGKKESRKLADFLKHAGIQFDAAYSSPLLRTRQTAEIILKTCNGSDAGPAKTVDELRNETSQDAFDRWLAHLSEARHCLLVGHAPTLAERAARLLGLARSDALNLEKTGLVCLETSNRRDAALCFYISPALLGE